MYRRSKSPGISPVFCQEQLVKVCQVMPSFSSSTAFPSSLEGQGVPGLALVPAVVCFLMFGPPPLLPWSLHNDGQYSQTICFNVACEGQIRSSSSQRFGYKCHLLTPKGRHKFDTSLVMHDTFSLIQKQDIQIGTIKGSQAQTTTCCDSLCCIIDFGLLGAVFVEWNSGMSARACKTS